MGYIKKSERSKRSKGSGVKAISRGSSFFFLRPLPSFAQGFFTRTGISRSVVMCLFCGKLLRYKSIILIADKLIILLKTHVAVTVFR